MIDVPAREEVERVPSPRYERPRGAQTTADGTSIVFASEGRVIVYDAKSSRPRATLPGSAADILDDGGIAVTDASGITFYDAELVKRRRIGGVGDATASPDGRFVAHLVALPNPDLDSFHERVPRVRDVATGEDVDLSHLLHDVPPDHVRAQYVIGNALHPRVITRGKQRFAWSVDIEGHEWDWNDEVRCEGDLTAKQNDPLHCLSPYGPIATSESAAPGDAHCRIGRYVLPLVVCSVGWGPSRSPLVAR